MTITTTIVAPVRTRRFSLSLVSAKPSPLLNLPAELVLDVLEQVLAETKPSVLSTLSKAINLLVETILYRTVVLHSKESVVFFHRTTLSRSPAFFASHVKKLVISYRPQNSVNFERAQRAIAVCTGARSLVLSMWFGIDCLASAMAQENESDGGVSEISLHVPDGMQSPVLCSTKDLELADSVNQTVSHLRICEPGEGWTAPEDILRPFGALRNLTHLQLSRRMNSNVENDRKFEDQVRRILETRRGLSVLAVVIFPQAWAPEENVCESDIWGMMAEVAKHDDRLVLVKGEIEDWGKQWRKANSRTGRDFWKQAVESM